MKLEVKLKYLSAGTNVLYLREGTESAMVGRGTAGCTVEGLIMARVWNYHSETHYCIN